VSAKEAALKSLEDSYARLLSGNEATLSAGPGAEPTGDTMNRNSLLPGISAVPDLALDYMRLFREVKVQATLYTMLMQQLETARIEEQKNTRVISVLDWAAPGDVPVYPQKMRLIAVAAIAAFAWVALFAVLIERLRERRDSAAEAARLAALRREWDRMPAWVRSIEKMVVK
jgi:capsule polysaccharide export protein KpsE/RkpR